MKNITLTLILSCVFGLSFAQMQAVSVPIHTRNYEVKSANFVEVESVPSKVEIGLKSKISTVQPEKWHFIPEGDKEKGKERNGIYVAKYLDHNNTSTATYVQSGGTVLATAKSYHQSEFLPENIKSVILSQYPNQDVKGYEKIELFLEQKTIYRFFLMNSRSEIILDSEGNSVSSTIVPKYIDITK